MQRRQIFEVFFIYAAAGDEIYASLCLEIYKISQKKKFNVVLNVRIK